MRSALKVTNFGFSYGKKVFMRKLFTNESLIQN